MLNKKRGEDLFRNPADEPELGFDRDGVKDDVADKPVECLGQTFPCDRARREHYMKLLAEKLKDPEFRKTPGFPQGTDEDILRLSDPPYYTACPNPFLSDFVRIYGKPYNPEDGYHREPFAVDVSEGKTDPLYKAHGYHTKVPHLAIVPSILHYTRPGDLVLDGFCGSGMTGVAAQWCGTAPESYRRSLEERWKAEGLGKPEWGVRRVILGDLSPAATFIAANYNIPVDVKAFEKAAHELLESVKAEIGWMYETHHTDGRKGTINYTVWSEIFSCPECGSEINFVEESLDEETNRVRAEFPCPSCGATLTKKRLERLYETRIDSASGVSVLSPKRKPVLINYALSKKKFEKTPDENDLEILRRLESMPLPSEVPTNRMMNSVNDVEVWGDEWRAGVAAFSHIHHLFLPRAAHALAFLWRFVHLEKCVRLRNMLLYFVEQTILGMSLMNRYSPSHFSQVNRYMSGRLRILSQHSEVAPWYILDGKLDRLTKAFRSTPSSTGDAMVSTGDCASIPTESSTIDYVFTDPPFGLNFAYAELNFIVEAWHRVFTNMGREAIVSSHQQKGVTEYQALMRQCFAEYHRVLRPGRWMTVVFSNSSNAIWRAIQEALGTAGFVVADVRTLDKKQGTFNQVHGISVNQDLIVSVYKPTEELSRQFSLDSLTPEAVWAFISEHLRNLPVFVGHSGQAEVIAERCPQMLHDRMIAFFVQRQMAIPLASSEFHSGLQTRYPMRDGMYFQPDQVAEYDRKRIALSELRQLSLFVSDEASAIQWLRRELHDKPRSFQDLQPEFMRETQGWTKHEILLELSDILEQNFLCYDGKRDVPNQIHSYLSTNFKDLRNLAKDDPTLRAKAKDRWYVPDPSKAGDLEKLREKSLLREFGQYKETRQRKLKVFRSEAVRAGFKAAYEQNDYATILAVAAMLPENVLQEDEKLLMYYDVASMRT